MKITKIELNDFHQFKNLTIDLTYPKGHSKEGEPLDKVCIIGQSGTGKTTLLKLIGGHTFTINSLFDEYKAEEFKGVYVTKKFDNIEVPMSVGQRDTPIVNTYFWHNIVSDGKPQDDIEKIFNSLLEKQKKHLEAIRTHFIFFPADLHYDLESSGTKLSIKNVID